MRIDPKHVSCAGWALVALLVCVSFSAWAETPAAPAIDATSFGVPPIIAWAMQSSSMPVIVGAVVWWLRGALGKFGGMPIVIPSITLDPDQFRRLLRALGRPEPEPETPSEDVTPDLAPRAQPRRGS